jgi:hypothetical protein
MTNKMDELLISLLREEIEAYGKLFYLLEDQRSALMQQDVDAILSLNRQVEEHSLYLKRLNQGRKEMVSEQHPRGETRIVLLIEEMKGPLRELFQELVREINRLIQESQRQLSFNQMLFRRAIDVGRETLRVLRPDGVNAPGIYRRDGNTANRRRNIAVACIARTA